MKVCVIGDVHGTEKFIQCYDKICRQDDDCQKIIVTGDWFDPYDDIPVDVMGVRFDYFLDCLHKDNRIVSLLGNHDLDGYVIDGETNRTVRYGKNRTMISDMIHKMIPESYLIYRIGKHLFSHAGVSQDWLDRMSDINNSYPELLMSNKKGWEVEELDTICRWYYGDFSYNGNCTYQGCTWIRPVALMNSLPAGYDQVVGHTRVENICNLKDEAPSGYINNDIWLVDNCGKAEYLTLNIEESE